MSIEAAGYLSDISAESFKRQTELDESVWRSLPFFAATFAFVAALGARAANDLPDLEWAWYSVATYGLFGAAALSLLWVLRWLIGVLRPREYEYPAKDAEIYTYATEVTEYYRALGLGEDEVDSRVLTDLRLFMARQYGNAASTNFVLNANRMKARSKALLFLLVGFLLALSCEATIFVVERTSAGSNEAVSDDERADDDGTQGSDGDRTDQRGEQEGAEADPSQVSAGNGRRALLGPESGSANPEQAVTKKPAGSSSDQDNPQRPIPPTSQYMAKDRAVELGNSSGNSRPQPQGRPEKE